MKKHSKPKIVKQYVEKIIELKYLVNYMFELFI